ncbi:MAG: endopeptidase La [Silvanigrellaceae bacterium]|nr:endopeptidase La [Silvanigrellaceae bacterium]
MQNNLEKIPENIPLLPLKDVVVFPHMVLPVFIAEDICLKAVGAAFNKDKYIFLSAFKVENYKLSQNIPALKCSTLPPFDVYDFGTVATILRTRKLHDGRTKVLLQGVTRALITDQLKQIEPYPIAPITALKESFPSTYPSDYEKLKNEMKNLIEKLSVSSKPVSPEILLCFDETQNPGKLADFIAGHLCLTIIDGQKILGATDPFERLRVIRSFLVKELENTDVSSSPRFFPLPNKDEFSKQQKEMALREQLRSIKLELGELDTKDEIEEFRNKISKAEMSEEAQSESLKQLRRLERMNPDSSEATLTRTYLECMVELPWKKTTQESIDLVECKRILDEDHYGLEKIKDRILEYIAVKKLNPNIKGPILCFVGPPGVGKTSLGSSIAKALHRKFARISLGGVRDEAEVRGHRRTYVGAMPGRIIQSIRNLGYKNPVLMLDEIDKLGNDFKGDPSSALLEVLDPEQNHNFSDHYLSTSFDLSQVIFLANANRLDTIPPPLRDRLEIIEVSGYSEEEKSAISKQFIIPKVIHQNGLTPDILHFHDNAVNIVISHYARGSGLRNLERDISTVVRKIARFVAENDEKGKERKVIKVTALSVRELLGEENYHSEDHDPAQTKVGVAIGLAYTQHGGEILELEVQLLPGKGHLMLTGHLGEVMKESAQTALSCLKSFASVFGISESKFTEKDVHLHIPAGAIPKDGPSAGIAIAIALASAFKNQPIPQHIALTGELSLHGKVLPIGGLKEKLLAALRAGIRIVCLPEKNRGTVLELPLTIRRRLEIKFVKSFNDVFQECFLNDSYCAPCASSYPDEAPVNSDYISAETNSSISVA